jgi:ribonucleotide monophosphatase NagD (HAD superfamily)
MAGKVLYAGKPHGPIYELALEKAAQLRGGPPDRSRVLAIGDSVRTDVTGAVRFGLDCLFVTSGIHAEELGGRDDPNPVLVQKILAEAGAKPRAITRKLRW